MARAQTHTYANLENRVFFFYFFTHFVIHSNKYFEFFFTGGNAIKTPIRQSVQAGPSRLA